MKGCRRGIAASRRRAGQEGDWPGALRVSVAAGSPLTSALAVADGGTPSK